MRRIYRIIFENRDLSEIQEDYHNNKWISKSELYHLFEYEKQQLLVMYKQKEDDYTQLLESFNLNSFASYSALERKYQNKLKKRP